MSASLAVQKAIRARLVATNSVTDLVPAVNILDRNSVPAPDPSIIVGEDQEVDEQRIARNATRVYSTIHIWKKEPSLVGVKAISGAIRAAVGAGRPPDTDGHQFGDFYVSGAHFVRDPDGVTSHGIVTVESLVMEIA